MKRKLYFGIFLVCLLSFLGRAQAFEVDGIYYEISSSADRTVKVVKPASPATYEGNIIIPASVSYDGETYRVASIGYSAFRDCTGLTAIELPTGLMSIEGYAFGDCTGLTAIALPAGLESIGNCTFYGCTGLTSIDLPEGLESIGYGAFWGCTGLTSIDLPDGLTSIKGATFYGCTGLTSIDLPAGLMSIEGGEDYRGGAFRGCTGLTEIVFPAGLESIGYSAFSSCTGLTSIALPAGLTSIEGGTFNGCTGLTSIAFPEGLESIGYSAFSSCTGLTEIAFPAGLESIGNRTFYGCTGLTSIDLPESLESIGSSAFSGCTGLTSIDLPDGLTSIVSGAFWGCTGLTEIAFPAGLASIGSDAFRNCDSLAAIELPSSLDSIGDRAFVGTEKLKEVFLWTSSWPELGGNEVWCDYINIWARPQKTLYTFIQERSDYAGWKDGFNYDNLKAKVVLSVSMEDTLHVYDGSVPLVSIEGNTSSFQMEVIQDSVDAGAGSHQIEELYFWFGKQGDEANKKISKAALPEPYLSYTITKAPLKATVLSDTVAYGEGLPKFELRYDGFVNGEDSSVLSARPIVVCEGGANPRCGFSCAYGIRGRGRQLRVYRVRGRDADREESLFER